MKKPCHAPTLDAVVWKPDVRIQAMANCLTVEEIVPLVEALAPLERTRLLLLIAKLPSDDSAIYALNPPVRDEFTDKHDPLAWDSEGWEQIP